jgi:hypothetical protein
MTSIISKSHQTQTLYLHRYFPKTTNFIAIVNQGEGDYFLVNEDDRVFEFDCCLKELSSTNSSLFEYISKRFEKVMNS